MLPDRVSNPGPLTYDSGALTIALRGPVLMHGKPCLMPILIQRYDVGSTLILKCFSIACS